MIGRALVGAPVASCQLPVAPVGGLQFAVISFVSGYVCVCVFGIIAKLSAAAINGANLSPGWLGPLLCAENQLENQQPPKRVATNRGRALMDFEPLRAGFKSGPSTTGRVRVLGRRAGGNLVAAAEQRQGI